MSVLNLSLKATAQGIQLPAIQDDEFEEVTILWENETRIWEEII